MPDDQITCDAVRFLLWPNPRAAGSTPDVEAARRHLDQCASCRSFFTVQAALEARLTRMRTQLSGCNDVLRARIRSALDPGTLDQGTARARPVRLIAALTILAAAAVLVITFQTSRRRAAMAMPLVAAATRSTPPDSAMDSSDSAGVAGWLGAHVGMAVSIPAIHDAHLMGGRLARIDNEPVAIVLYRMHGAPLVYLASPSMAIAGRRMDTTAAMVHLDLKGYQVAIWGEPDGARAIVAPMSRDEVHDIVVECRAMTARTS